jgi:hypothetical protein
MHIRKGKIRVRITRPNPEGFHRLAGIRAREERRNFAAGDRDRDRVDAKT